MKKDRGGIEVEKKFRGQKIALDVCNHFNGNLFTPLDVDNMNICHRLHCKKHILDCWFLFKTR